MTENPIAKRHVVLSLPGMDDVQVSRNINCTPGVRMDVYRPPAVPSAGAASLPAVVLVIGYVDANAVGRRLLGCSLKDCAPYIDWAKLVACSGMVAVTYENEDPVRDARTLIRHLRTNARIYGIDPSRVAVWSSSGNVPNALSLLLEDQELSCAALCYGYMTDAPGCDEVARAAKQFGFVNPLLGRDVRPPRQPMVVLRAGRDEMPGLNASLDGFVASALEANVPLTLVNHAEGIHGFDIMDSSRGSRLAIGQVLEFLRARLL